MEHGPRPSPEGEQLPNKQLAAVQLLRACNALTYLETRGRELRQYYGQERPQDYDATLDATMRGVRLVIFARYRDLIAQGDGPVGRLILTNTLGERQPHTSLSHHPRPGGDAA
jgi:hypothetical protein